MDRRTFLTTTGAAAAAATTTARAQSVPSNSEVTAPAVAKGLQELRLVMPWPDRACGFADQAGRLARRITRMSDGRYRIVASTGAGSGFDAVRAGDADLYHATELDHLDAHRALAYFAGLPGDRGMEPAHLAAWMLVGGGQTLWDELAGDFGVKALLAGHSGDPACFLATRRVTEMNELGGQTVSVKGLARDVVRGLGLVPAAVEAPGLAHAMAHGDILAAEWGGALVSHALGLSAAAPFAVGTSINRHGFALSLGVRRSLWDRMSDADREIFLTAAAAEYQLALAEDNAHRHVLRPEPPADRRWPLARELERAIRRVADAVVAQVAASDAHAQHINASYIAFRHALLGDDISGAV